MKIKYKLFLSFLCIVVVFVISGLYINSNVIEMDSSTKDLMKSMSVNQASSNYLQGARALQVGVYMSMHGEKDMGKQLMNEGIEEMNASKNNLKQLLSSKETLEILSQAERLEVKVVEASNNVIQTLDNPSLTEQNLGTLQGRIAAFELKLKDLDDIARQRMNTAMEESKATSENTVKITYIGVIGSMLFSLILSFIMASRITNPLKILTETANNVSRGDINAKVNVNSNDEIAKWS